MKDRLHREGFLWNWPQVNATRPYWSLVKFGSGNGMVLAGNKPLPQPMLTQIFVTMWPQRFNLSTRWFYYILKQQIVSFCRHVLMNGPIYRTSVRNQLLFIKTKDEFEPRSLQTYCIKWPTNLITHPQLSGYLPLVITWWWGHVRRTPRTLPKGTFLWYRRRRAWLQI